MSDIDKLTELLKLLKDRKEFAPGDIVHWKRGLRNKRFPKDEQPAIVVEQLSKPIIDGTKDAGSNYFREPLDLILGIIDEDGELSVYYYDSRKFEKRE